MREAGVTLVSVGDLLLGLLEPTPGEYDFGWLDRVLDLLHENGIRVDLGTPDRRAAAWFFRRHPEALPSPREGCGYGFGSRGSHLPSNAATTARPRRASPARSPSATRDHPALAMWHVHNEYGVPVGACYCDVLRRRTSATGCATTYGDLDALNEAWGTAFWGQRYARLGRDRRRRAPRRPSVNPAQRLDFARFARRHHAARTSARERDILHRLAPGVPVTTNFMTALSQCDSVDYWALGAARSTSSPTTTT